MLVKVPLVFIIINRLNADQVLIQIKTLEKVQHIDSVQLSQTDCPLHGRMAVIHWLFKVNSF